MWQRFLLWIREAINKMITTSNVKTALNIDVAITPKMADALQKWSNAYINEPHWFKTGMKKLNLAATVASEIARAVTIEMDVKITGSARAVFIQEQFDKIYPMIRTVVEYGVAKGGLMFKPYVEGEYVCVDFVQADMFYPVEFDANGKIRACVFADQKTMGNDYYTRLEFHRMTADGYEIMNSAYKSHAKDMLGSKVPLSSVDAWKDLEEFALIENVDRPLFAYFKNPLANTIDPTSPIGVSCYSRAMDLFAQADQQWTDFLWEFQSGNRALYVDELAFELDKSTGKRKVPDLRLYRMLKTTGTVGGKENMFEDWTPTIREVNYLNGLDGMLKRVEFACGLAQGTLSDPNAVAMTATEIKMSKQRTYATVTDTQKALQSTLEDLFYAIDMWCTMAGLAPVGKYTATYTFDDSVVADHDTQFSQDSQAVGMQAMSKVEFRMRTYGESEEEARKMIAMVTEEMKTENLINDQGADDDG